MSTNHIIYRLQTLKVHPYLLAGVIFKFHPISQTKSSSWFAGCNENSDDNGGDNDDDKDICNDNDDISDDDDDGADNDDV